MKNLVSILRKYKVTDLKNYQSIIRIFYQKRIIKATTVNLWINNQCKIKPKMINNQSICKKMSKMKHLKQYLTFKYIVIRSEMHSLKNNET